MRFLLISDTHLGRREAGYNQQPDYTERSAAILAALQDWITTDGNIDFVMHGGDLLDATDVELMRQAAALYALTVPVYLCLGNHDLTEVDAVETWLSTAPGFFADDVHFEVVTDDAVVHVLPNHWGPIDYHWADVQEPRLSEAQVGRLESALLRYADRPQIICTHAPVAGVGTAQTGFETVHHPPAPAYQQYFLSLLDSHPTICAILTGHSHIGWVAKLGRCAAVSGSAFSESPFEFKLIEVTPARLSVRTFDLFSAVDFRAAYDFGRTYVQGRPCDRELELLLGPIG